MDMFMFILISSMILWIVFIVCFIIGVKTISHLRNEVYFLKESYLKLKRDCRKLERMIRNE